jgi:formyltetrahydrofolate deformylase
MLASPATDSKAERSGMDSSSPRQIIITLACPSTTGIVAAVSTCLSERGWNIIESSQFVDRDRQRFFMRLSCETETGEGDPDGLRRAFKPIAARFAMEWNVWNPTEKPRLLIMVSRFGHCLNDLLYRYSIGALPVEIVGVVSNHRDFEAFTASHGLPFHHMPVTRDTKAEQESRLLDLIESRQVDLVVLARYMQVLSDDLCRRLAGRAINIHHSFLPSFKGAKPYHQAHRRGVKLIGATAHYVTPDLDEGPIIEQDLSRVSHAMSAEDYTAIGRDIESVVLARAVKLHVERRVFINGDCTVVFG